MNNNKNIALESYNGLLNSSSVKFSDTVDTKNDINYIDTTTTNNDAIDSSICQNSYRFDNQIIRYNIDNMNNRKSIYAPSSNTDIKESCTSKKSRKVRVQPGLSKNIKKKKNLSIKKNNKIVVSKNNKPTKYINSVRNILPSYLHTYINFNAIRLRVTSIFHHLFFCIFETTHYCIAKIPHFTRTHFEFAIWIAFQYTFIVKPRLAPKLICILIAAFILLYVCNILVNCNGRCIELFKSSVNSKTKDIFIKNNEIENSSINFYINKYSNANQILGKNNGNCHIYENNIYANNNRTILETNKNDKYVQYINVDCIKRNDENIVLKEKKCENDQCKETHNFHKTISGNSENNKYINDCFSITGKANDSSIHNFRLEIAMPKKDTNIIVKNILESYRSSLLLIVIVCIFACDFKFFPMRFLKTDFYGLSLMDIGIGSFLFLNGVFFNLEHCDRWILNLFKECSELFGYQCLPLVLIVMIKNIVVSFFKNSFYVIKKYIFS
ncbi:hypothetical protein EDEG_01532 [Edhazardia aedis USNM 41457]|uniref:GPI-anchored wall transfer protein n=1 Tax=Edhazardia aedis (strain USNM 41457) TaxID=1003232 RepID=J9DSA3_EDHAE|nr:hypothetical protein EDEG_01532 [Edhazardia aedis USNM 41457]|eukprot:EJW04182.1 hypothetical protein EDEG_01532 [Edhazardia aedis USNM 41457]